jgi:hypothetical protein
MRKKSPLIIVESDEDIPVEKLSSIYENAEIIYGFKPSEKRPEKFYYLFNKKIYTKAADKYVDYINDEFRAIFKQKNNHKIALLNYFTPHRTSPLFIFFLIKEIHYLHPTHSILVISSNKIILNIYKRFNPLNLKNIEIIFKSRSSLRWLIDDYFKKSPFKSIFLINNIIRGFIWLLQIIKFKYTNSTQQLKTVDLLLLSRGFRYWQKWKCDQFMDFYYSSFMNKINKGSSLTAYCLTHEIKSNTAYKNYSMANYLPLRSLLKLLVKSLIDCLKMIPNLKSIWVLHERNFFEKLIFTELLEATLKVIRVRAVIYYDEVYSLGKLANFILKKMGIDSYGFQHGIDTYSHLTYKSYRLYKQIPELFPQYFFIYGSYSEKLFCLYGYSVNKMIKIGFDRLGVSDRVSKKETKRTVKSDVLFIGQRSWSNEAFYELHQQRYMLPIRRLFFRPHPSFPILSDSFESTYPDAILLNSEKTNVIDDIANVDCVIGFFSTSLLTAIYLRKITVFWQAYGVEDLLDMNYWGAQVIDSLDQIDWTKKADPRNVLEECSPRTDIAEFFEKKYRIS